MEDKENRLKEAEQQTQEILRQIEKKGGKWTTNEQIINHLSSIPYKKDKSTALKFQICYRKEIQKQNVEDKNCLKNW